MILSQPEDTIIGEKLDFINFKEQPAMNDLIIKYTTTDGCTVDTPRAKAFGAKIIDNTYENGIGCIHFDAPVTMIAYRAFDYCTNLKSIVLPNSVIRIGKEAFRYCENLERVTAYTGLQTIGYGAFDGCSNLMEFDIPESVTNIDSYAFHRCESLEAINIPVSSSIGYAAFAWCAKINKVYIPDNVKFKGNAFVNCKRLTRFIGKYPSDNGRCLIVNGVLISFAPKGLGMYCVPNSVRSIGESAFYNCDKLIDIHIPDGVVSISASAFEGCSRLESVNIPSSVTKIDIDAFEHCPCLKKVFVEDLHAWMNINFFPCFGTNPIDNNASLIHNGRLLTSLVVPSTITRLKDMAFCGCLSLVNVITTDGLVSIGNYAFFACASLESVTLPDGLIEIGEYAFFNCQNLKDIYCKATVPPAGGEKMFEEHIAGRRIFVPKNSVQAYKSADYWAEYGDDIIGLTEDNK